MEIIGEIKTRGYTTKQPESTIGLMIPSESLYMYTTNIDLLRIGAIERMRLIPLPNMDIEYDHSFINRATLAISDTNLNEQNLERLVAIAQKPFYYNDRKYAYTPQYMLSLSENVYIPGHVKALLFTKVQDKSQSHWFAIKIPDDWLYDNETLRDLNCMTKHKSDYF